MQIREVRPDDAEAWLRMRRALWPEGPEAEHRDEIEAFFAGTFPRKPWAVLLAKDASGRPVGFAELSERAYAEGCVGHRIAYLEGWYVEPAVRGQGVGRALIEAAEDWARARGCAEFASDTAPDNTVSLAAHRALGFEDAGLIRCFLKKIDA